MCFLRGQRGRVLERCSSCCHLTLTRVVAFYPGANAVCRGPEDDHLLPELRARGVLLHPLRPDPAAPPGGPGRSALTPRLHAVEVPAAARGPGAGGEQHALPRSQDPAHSNSSSGVRELPWQASPGAGRINLLRATRRTWTPVLPPCLCDAGAYCSHPLALPELGARRPTWPASTSASC